MLRAHLTEQEIRDATGIGGTGDRVVDGVAAAQEDRPRCLYWFRGPIPPATSECLSGHGDCIVLTGRGASAPGDLGTCLVLETPDPRAAIARVLGLIRSLDRLAPMVDTDEIAPSARISPLALVLGPVAIGPDAEVGPFCMIGPDVSIGRGSVLRSGVRVFGRVSIGDHSVVEANAVVGNEGFGFVGNSDDGLHRMPHLGGVRIGSNVEVGALAVIEAGSITPTDIGDGSKIGDLCLVGHGARIGTGVRLVGGVILGGSAIVDDHAWIGLNATVRDGRRVGRRALVGMDVPVLEDLDDDTVSRAARPDTVRRRPPAS